MSKGYYLNKGGYYVIDKQYLGQRICETTRYRKGQAQEVEALIRQEMDAIYEATRRGQRPVVTFRQCAVEYCVKNQHQKQIGHFEGMLRRLDPYIGDVPAHELHQQHASIKRLVSDLKTNGRKNCTINAYTEAIARVLTAATQWRHDWCDLTWLEKAPMLEKLSNDYRAPRPISWAEQELFLAELPEHLRGELLVYVNTGLRDDELNSMRWDNELALPGGITGFVVDAKGSKRQKNRQRLVLFNSIAASVINSRRGEHEEYVFCYRGEPKCRTNNSSWKKARARAGLDVRVQDLRHTFGHRLLVAGVNEKTRAELLGHGGKTITQHYSAESLQLLYDAVSTITVPTEHQAVIDLNEWRRRKTG